MSFEEDSQINNFTFLDFTDRSLVCPTCEGEGYGIEANLYKDWLNYSDLTIVCPDCNGSGIWEENQ